MFKIGILNTRNNKINRAGGIREDGKDNAKLIAEHINKADYLFLGTQELTYNITKRLNVFLKKHNIYGGYRLGNCKIIRKLFKKYNESNAVITKQKVKKVKNYLLPFFPWNFKDMRLSFKKKSVMPRIATMVILEYGEKEICVINTHLDYYIKSIQKRQLKKLLKIIKKNYQKYEIVLCGDFNLEIKHKIFKEFTKELENYKIKRVMVDTKTNSQKFKNKTAIDHIFVPESWEINEAAIITDSSLNGITDHTGIFVNIAE